MQTAHKLVSEVKACGKEISEIYKVLCHSFPVLVMQCGLCQAVAFHLSKSGENKTDREKAHTFIIKHIKQVLVLQNINDIFESDSFDYINFTKRTLNCWIYFKRFAISIPPDKQQTNKVQ